MTVVEASRDFNGLERFLPMFIEKAASRMSELAARRRTARRDAALNPERVARAEQAGVAVPHAFELWIGHLGWLDRISTGVAFSLDDLTMEEARGLALLRQEREKFWRTHSACPHCQSVNARNASFCGGCGTDFR